MVPGVVDRNTGGKLFVKPTYFLQFQARGYKTRNDFENID